MSSQEFVVGFKAYSASTDSLQFADTTGRVWTVREVQATVPGRESERCLILDTRDIARRVWRYPSNWRELRGDALLALLDAR